MYENMRDAPVKDLAASVTVVSIIGGNDGCSRRHQLVEQPTSAASVRGHCGLCIARLPLQVAAESGRRHRAAIKRANSRFSFG